MDINDAMYYERVRERAVSASYECDKIQSQLKEEKLKCEQLARQVSKFLCQSSWTENRNCRRVLIVTHDSEELDCGILQFKKLESALSKAFPDWQSWETRDSEGENA